MPTNAPPAKMLSFGRRTGQPIAVRGSMREMVNSVVREDIQLIPESLVLLVHLPNFGYVWNWPVACSVSRSGVTQRQAMLDVTRLAIWTLGLVAGLFALAMFIIAQRCRQQ